MRFILRLLVIIYGIYLALAVLVVSPLLNFWPAKYVQDNYQRELQTRWVYFNPLTLSLNLSEGSLKEPNGDAFLGLGKTSINLSLESIWQPGIVFDEIHLEGVSLTIIHLENGRFNFSSLLPADEELGDEPAATEGETFPITIHSIYLQASNLNLGDDERTPPYRGEWKDLSLSALDFSTIKENHELYRFDITSPRGGKLSWEGQLSVLSASSSGRLEAKTLSMVEIGRAAEPWINFSTLSGDLGLELEYAVSWKDALTYSAKNSALHISNLEIAERHSDRAAKTGLRLASLDISSIEASSEAEQAKIGDIAINGLDLEGWFKDQRFSLAELFTGEPVADSTSTASPESKAEPETQAEPDTADETNAWAIQVMRIGLRDSSLILESPFTSPEPLQFDPISITLTDLHWPFQGESTVDAAININSTATAVVAGTLTLDTGDATLQYSLSDFQLPLIDAALPEELQAVLAGGAVSAEGTASLHEFAPVNLTSNIEVKDFALQDANSEITLSEWRTLQFKDIDANFDETALSIAQVNLVRYNGIIHLDESGTLNLANLWKETAADVDSPEAEPVEESAAANTDSRPGSGSDENNTSDTNWSVDLPELTISESSVDFTDRSLPIVFRATIEEIEGKVRGLNNEVSQEATVDIRGTVDGYSPVLLTGTFNLLVDPAAHDLALKFKALDLSSLSPYASTYAGREIDRGLLNANLSYKMQQPNFTGDISLRIEKLKLGARVESDKALDLPLDLALAILTDTRGVIEMNVPVGGDISEPGYQFGSVMTKAVVGIIREAVTSPFKLLASIVGSEQDFSHINFAPGSSTLDEKGIQALGKLAAALQQRPAIKLKIFGKIDPESDRRGLQKLILKEQLIKAGLTEEQIAEKGAVLERAIDKRFQALADDKAEQRDLPILEKLDQVLEGIPIPDQTLLELSTRRATAVHDVLVTQLGLQDDRISVKEAVLEKSENNFSGALLSVK